MNKSFVFEVKPLQLQKNNLPKLLWLQRLTMAMTGTAAQVTMITEMGRISVISALISDVTNITPHDVIKWGSAPIQDRPGTL